MKSRLGGDIHKFSVVPMSYLDLSQRFSECRNLALSIEGNGTVGRS